MRFVVTAGPTREPIDPVRFLSNRSSGKMGYAIAEAAIEAGHEVALISGPVNLRAPENARSSFQSTRAMKCMKRCSAPCAIAMCSSCARRSPITSRRNIRAQKLKKKSTALSLDLVPTRDILASLAKAGSLVSGGRLRGRDAKLEANAQKKLREKNCDMIVANDVSTNDYGMEC